MKQYLHPTADLLLDTKEDLIRTSSIKMNPYGRDDSMQGYWEVIQ